MLFERKLAGKGGVPNLLTTRDVIRYATVEGAGCGTVHDDRIADARPGRT